METTPVQLTPELRAAIAARPDEPLYVCDKESQKTYLLIENGKFPDLQEELIRAKLDEGFAAIERGDVEEWDAESVKTEGRRILKDRQERA